MIIATTPRTAEQRIDYSRIPALQLPEGQNPEKAQEYYNAQLLDNSTPFYRSCLSMAQMSMNNQIVRIVAPTQHIANTIDEESRTFAFFLPLENQWQSYTQGGQTRMLWRFRPGDRVRLHVAVEKMENVYVVPREGVIREGPDAYVFRQNGDLFDRRPVHVLAEDRASVVIANDGSLKPGSYVAQNAAASINRVLKAQMASGQPTNIHVHADGTVHAAH